MSAQKSSNSNVKRIVILLILLVVIIGGYFLYTSGLLGGNSCEALKRRYDKADSVEDYKAVSEAFTKMMELGCDF